MNLFYTNKGGSLGIKLKAGLMSVFIFFASSFSVEPTLSAWQITTLISGNLVSTGIWGESRIIEPEVNEVVSSTTDLLAYYLDENGDGNDNVQWAVRAGTCAAGTGTMFGNVDGFSTPFTWDGANFSATIDTTTVDDGLYCFVFNPTEDAGNANQRLTRNFYIQNNAGPLVCDDTVSSFDEFNLGSVDGQEDWSATGPYDQEIVANTFASVLGCQSLRVSNALTSGSFADWIFSPSVTNEAGETDAINSGYSGGVRQNLFEAEFDITAATSTYQPDLQVSVSPDRGDGARMSYLRFADQVDGIHVFFNDYSSGMFNETDIATLDRALVHNIRFEMKFVDGSANDVVEIYINDVLTFTGTSWEDFFRDNQPAIAPPTVDSLLIQARSNQGGDVPANLGGGFLFDNVVLETASNLPEPPPAVAAGDVVINEIMWMGTTVSADDEWLELRNMTSDPIDVSLWSIEGAGVGSAAITIPDGTIIEANDFYLISNFSADNSALSDSIIVDYVNSSLSFVNTGEQLTLWDNAGNIIDQTPAGSWAEGVNDTEKQSMERNSIPGDGTLSTSWHTCIAAGCNDTTFWDVEGDDYGTPRATNLSENDPTASEFVPEGLFVFATELSESESETESESESESEAETETGGGSAKTSADKEETVPVSDEEVEEDVAGAPVDAEEELNGEVLENAVETGIDEEEPVKEEETNDDASENETEEVVVDEEVVEEGEANMEEVEEETEDSEESDLEGEEGVTEAKKEEKAETDEVEVGAVEENEEVEEVAEAEEEEEEEDEEEVEDPEEESETENDSSDNGATEVATE